MVTAVCVTVCVIGPLNVNEGDRMNGFSHSLMSTIACRTSRSATELLFDAVVWVTLGVLGCELIADEPRRVSCLQSGPRSHGYTCCILETCLRLDLHNTCLQMHI